MRDFKYKNKSNNSRNEPRVDTHKAETLLHNQRMQELETLKITNQAQATMIEAQQLVFSKDMDIKKEAIRSESSLLEAKRLMFEQGKDHHKQVLANEKEKALLFDQVRQGQHQNRLHAETNAQLQTQFKRTELEQSKNELDAKYRLYKKESILQHKLNNLEIEEAFNKEKRLYAKDHPWMAPLLYDY